MALVLAPENPRPWGAETMTALLRTEELTCQFGGLVAVGGVSLAVQTGDVHGLIGPNGAGKTTFLNLISGHIRQTSGAIFFNGNDLGTTPPERRAAVGNPSDVSEPAVVSRDERDRKRNGGPARQ